MASVIEAALLQSLGLQVPTDQPGQQGQSQQGQQPGQQASMVPTSGALDNVARNVMRPPTLVPQGSGTYMSGPASGRGGAAVQAAQRYLGHPYQYGGLDCSGLVQQVYGSLGVNLPRTTYQQINSGQPVGSLAQAQPGDLIFLHPSAAGPGHVGIYTGNGNMIDANHTGGSVGVRPVAGYGPIVAIRRV